MHGSRLRTGLFVLVLLLFMPVAAQPTGLPDDLSGDAEARGFADLLFAHGRILLAEKDFAAALPLFEKAARTLPRDATYAYFAALCKLRLDRYEEAIEDLRGVLPPADGRIGEARVRYDLGDGYYRIAQYEDALRELRRSTTLDDRAASAHFYLGLVEFAKGDTSAAFVAFARASALDPSLTEEGDYYRGVAAYESGDLAAARGYFEQVLTNVTEPGTADSGRQWLEFLDQVGGADSSPRNDLRVGFLMEHDDNPGQLNDDVVIPGVGSDIRGVLRIRGAYRPLISKVRSIALVLNTYNSRHAEFEEADLDAVQGVIQFTHGGDPTGFINGPAGYARVPTGLQHPSWLFQLSASTLARQDESLRRDLEVASTVLLHQGEFGKLDFSLAYDDVTFFDAPNTPYSGHKISARLGQYFYFGQGPWSYLRLGVGRTSHDTRMRALDRDSDTFQAELALPLGDHFNLFLLGGYREDDYDLASAQFYGMSRPRSDETIEAVAKLTLSLARYGYLTFRYSLTDRDSPGLAFATYDRRISSLGYTRQW